MDIGAMGVFGFAILWPIEFLNKKSIHIVALNPKV